MWSFSLDLIDVMRFATKGISAVFIGTEYSKCQDKRKPLFKHE